MAEVVFSDKPVSVNSLKKSPSIGAAICCYGLKGVMVVVHGAQGCSAYPKTILIEHFKEPVPITNTALQETEVVFGTDTVKASIKNLLNSNPVPEIIAVLTSGMVECRGDDVEASLKEFKLENPEFASFPVFFISTPDFEGGLQFGFEKALYAIIDNFVKPVERKDPNLITLLCGASLTPGDIDEIKRFISSFGFDVIVIPDLADSLIGKMYQGIYYPYTIGGVSLKELERAGSAFLTIAVGTSTITSAKLLKEKCGIPFEHFPSLSNFREVDRLAELLYLIKGFIPETIKRDREIMQDALADTHFYLNCKRFGVAGIPEVVYQISDFLHSVGGKVVAAVSSEYGDELSEVPADKVVVGDMEDFENLCMEENPHIIFGSSHLHLVEEKSGIPLIRVDFPVYDRVGYSQKRKVCYRGITDFLFEISNEMLSRYIEKPFVVKGGRP
ncbi:nitrogenase iron-molybdenum cofactor biosynthesis protein NifN [Desulfurobacterium atlanticum]|uniref:Nitrogenase iron-molybdenum cofactor biosynthesis protein NifN n=1 Tax=Desulfurobacterium atlanticum TaxID=240169 RepID=A0A238YRF5_9BACT|nr:nitrogenase iron-molybdenum cofactor biosynthesis protein NifN [Desulfurobacterium atlanticum]SNR73019.1 nitrogenase molybdenum-iron protein NifN [Desulfurobacterium atlanticum]